MAVTYVTLYLRGSNQPVQVVEGSTLHLIYASMGASATPGVNPPTQRPDPFPQYVHDDEVSSIIGEAQDSAVAALVDDSDSATGVALSAAFAPRRAARLAEIVSAKASTVMSPAATISEVTNFVASGSTGTTLPAPIHYPFDQAGKWRFLGFVPEQVVTGGTPRAYYHNAVLGSSPATAGLQPAGRVEFMHAGQAVEVILGAGNDGQYRIMADDQWVTSAASGALPPDGGRHLVKVDFGTRGVRKITVEFERLRWGGVNIAGTDGIWQAAAPPTGVLVLGDSWAYGQGAARLGTGFVATMAAALGWRNVYNCGLPSSGYVNPSSHNLPFGARVVPMLAGMGGQPDAIVVVGSVNDSLGNSAGNTLSALSAATTALYADLATRCPQAPVFVIGWQMPKNAAALSQEAQDKAAAIKAAALAAPNVVYIDNNAAGDPWVTGTGKVGATVGDGNADVLIGSDGVHATQEGHDVYGQRIARAIRNWYFSQVRGIG